MAATTSKSKDLRYRLESTLFIGFNGTEDPESIPTPKPTSSSSPNGYPEKLMFYSNILEEKYNQIISKKTMASASNNNEEDEEEFDDDNNAVGNNKKNAVGSSRVICITIRKNLKVRLHKVKFDHSSLKIVKSWSLDELKSLESSLGPSVIISLGKPYKWSFENKMKKAEFLFTMIKFSKKYLKRQPKFVKINEDEVKAELKLKDSFLSTTDKFLIDQFAANYQEIKPYSPTDDILEEVDESNLDQLEANNEAKKEALIQICEVELEEILKEFQWEVGQSAEDLEAKLYSELQALEAANVYDIIQNEDSANSLISQIHSAMKELDTIDQWLIHYTNILDSMGADVHQVELRNKNLQIASANQKLLLEELTGLMGQLKFPGYLVEILQHEPLEFTDGIAQCEEATTKLMSYIQLKFENGVNTMQAVKERLALFREYGDAFAKRLVDFIVQTIKTETDTYLNDTSRMARKGGGLRLYGHETIEEKLFRFRKLLQWLKEFDPRKHTDLMVNYLHEIQRVITKEIGEFLDTLKQHQLNKKYTAEEQNHLFSVNTVSVTTVASNALKNVVSTTTGKSAMGGGSLLKSKKPMMNKKGIIVPEGLAEGRSGSLISLDIAMTDDKINPVEVFQNALAMIAPFFVREQNLVLDIFSLLIRKDFPSGATSHLSETALSQWQETLGMPHEPINDMKLHKKVFELMKETFSTVGNQIINLIELTKHDPTYSLGMMVQSELMLAEYERTGHSFLIYLLEELLTKSRATFDKFIDNQVDVISETKLSIKKRSGVLPSFTTFPRFIDQLERFVVAESTKSRGAALMGYERIIKALFISLEEVSKEVMDERLVTAAGGDDREFVNIHILNIENMHYFFSELRGRKIAGLEVFVKQSKAIYENNLNSYCQVVIRKPLGRLLEYFEGVQELLKSRSAEEVSFHLSFSKNALKDVLKKYSEKELRKGLESLFKRVQKHFSDDGESSRLMPVVWRGIQEQLLGHFNKFENLIAQCYPEANLKLEFSLKDVVQFLTEMG